LAGHYDVFSGEQILDWHHAAGDFVVRLGEDGGLALRLVTVRRYGALAPGAVVDLGSALAAAALFCVHTTLWLRLDRCEGVGALVLADPGTIEPALAGIFEALEAKVRNGALPAGMPEAIAAYLGTISREDLVAMIMALAGRRPAGDSTRSLLGRAAPVHAAQLQRLWAS
jgi:hypothetical protein